MRIRIIKQPTRSSMDGVRLDHFATGEQYEVGDTLGAYMLAEGWAEPAPSDEPTPAISRSELDPEIDPAMPPNLQREIYPSYYDGPPALATDRRRVRRRR